MCDEKANRVITTVVIDFAAHFGQFPMIGEEVSPSLGLPVDRITAQRKRNYEEYGEVG